MQVEKIICNFCIYSTKPSYITLIYSYHINVILNFKLKIGGIFYEEKR